MHKSFFSFSNKSAAFKWLLTSLFFLSAAGNVNAQMWITDGSGDEIGNVITVYPGYNRGIYITGCTFSNPFGAAGIYVIANSGATESQINGSSLTDAGGNPNIINSFISCGYVQDELIASTASLSLGEYDVVIDRNNNGRFDKGIDEMLNPGPSFTFKLVSFEAVTINSPFPHELAASAQELVNRTKQNAIQTRDKLQDIYDRYKTAQLAISLFDALRGAGVGTILNIRTGTAIWNLTGSIIAFGITNSQTSLDYFTNPLQSTLAHGAAEQAAEIAIARYDAIAKDPPRSDYSTLAVVDSVDLDFSFKFNDTADIFFTRLYALMNMESRVVNAELLSLERLQGALIDSSASGVYLQSRNLLYLARLKGQLQEFKIQNWNYFRSAFVAKGLANELLPVSELQSFQSRMLSSGFADAHKLYFERQSFTPEEVSQIKEQAIRGNYAPLNGKTYLQLIDEAIGTEQGIKQAVLIEADSLLALSDRFGNTLDTNSLLADFEISGPAQISGRKHSTPGQAANCQYLAIDGSSTPVSSPQMVFYRANRTFNSTAASPVLNDPGFELVRLEINTSGGLKSFAYKVIEVTPGIESPKILSVQPEPYFIKPSTQEPVLFKVTSASTPAGFAPIYDWYINGIPAAQNVDSLLFTPLSCEKNVFEVQVIVRDDALGNFEHIRQWQVQVDGDSSLCGVNKNAPNRKNATHWYFGTQAGLKFVGGSQPIPLTNSVMPNQHEGVATISDSAGNLLFYTQGITVYNRNHQVMQNGTGLTSNPSNTQAAVIVPYPGHPNLYYIVTPAPYNYSIVDMTLDNDNGAIIADKKNILLQTQSSEKIAAVYAANQKDIWLVTCASSQRYFNAFLITENGMSPQPVKSDFSQMGLPAFSGNYGYMKISPDGKHLVTADFGNYFHLFDFDTRTGVVSNLRRIVPPKSLGGLGSYGIEFSPDGKLVYVADHRGAHSVNQFDISSGDITEIQNSQVVLPTNVNVALGALQLGPDGKMYLGRENSPYLGVINFPNVKGAGCNLVPNGVFLGGKVSQLGLPGFISSILVNNDITWQGDCTGAPTSFTLDRELSIVDSVYWVFGDTLSAGNADTGVVVNHIYTSPGSYTVQAIVVYDTLDIALYDTIYTKVTIKAPVINPVHIITPDQWPTCKDTVWLAASAFGDGYQWYKDGKVIPGANKMDIRVTESGSYGLEVKSINGCPLPPDSAIAQVVFLDNDVNPVIAQNGGKLTTTLTYATYQWYMNGEILPDETLQTITPTADGEYHVVVTNTDGCEGESKKFMVSIVEPFVLLSFTVVDNECVDAMLQWKTTGEKNLSHFEIQQSADSVNFVTLKQEAEENTPDIHEYTATVTIDANKEFFRLKMVNMDGSFAYSDIISLSTNCYLPFSIYPNPVKSILYVRSAPVGADYRIYNSIGQLVARGVIDSGNTAINVSRLSSGMYVILINGETANKFIKRN